MSCAVIDVRVEVVFLHKSSVLLVLNRAIQQRIMCSEIMIRTVVCRILLFQNVDAPLRYSHDQLAVIASSWVADHLPGLVFPSRYEQSVTVHDVQYKCSRPCDVILTVKLP